MPSKTTSFFHLHLVSDSTAETLLSVARAAAAQYATVHPVEHIYPAVRTNRQLDRVLAEIESEPGVVLYTLLEPDLIGRLGEEPAQHGPPCWGGRGKKRARSASPACRSWVRCCGFSSPISAPSRPTGSAPSTCSMR